MLGHVLGCICLQPLYRKARAEGHFTRRAVEKKLVVRIDETQHLLLHGLEGFCTNIGVEDKWWSA